jgi:hypothetical protein
VLGRAGEKVRDRSSSEEGWTPESGGPIKGLSDRKYVSLLSDLGLFSTACSFSKRFIFNFDSWTNFSMPWLQGLSGLSALAAWTTSFLPRLSICKASK